MLGKSSLNYISSPKVIRLCVFVWCMHVFRVYIQKLEIGVECRLQSLHLIFLRFIMYRVFIIKNRSIFMVHGDLSGDLVPFYYFYYYIY